MKMTLTDWIKNHRAAIDRIIKKEVKDKNYIITDDKRRLWVLDNENLYNWAAKSVDMNS